MLIMILSGATLAVTLAIVSLRMIQEGKSLIHVVLQEHKAFLGTSIGFSHGVMAHMGSQDYEKLISLALECQSLRYIGILDGKGELVAQSAPPTYLRSLKKHRFSNLTDSEILEEADSTILIAYKAEEIEMDENHRRHHATFKGRTKSFPQPAWFLVGLDTSLFKKHYHDMVVQTIGIGGLFLLLGVLVIVFLGILQRYELAQLAIEKLERIKRLLGHFVPRTAKNLIERDPEKKGILDKYIRDATVLFLDIEGFSLLVDKHPIERINRTIEIYF